MRTSGAAVPSRTRNQDPNRFSRPIQSDRYRALDRHPGKATAAVVSDRALDRHFTRGYPELLRLAQQLLAEMPTDDLVAESLVHEIYLQTLGSGQTECDSMLEFFDLAEGAMRRVLTTHLRRQSVATESRFLPNVSLGEFDISCTPLKDQLIDLEIALRELRRLHPRGAEIVEARFYSDLTDVKIAHQLGISKRRVNHGWEIARAWLADRMEKRPSLAN